KHNYLVTRADEIGPTLREAFFIARSGRPGPVLVDITKDAQQGSAEVTETDPPVRLRGYRPDHRPGARELDRALDLVQHAQRPIVFCGHGVVRAVASALVLELAERLRLPGAPPPPGRGGFPAPGPPARGRRCLHGRA